MALLFACGALAFEVARHPAIRTLLATTTAATVALLILAVAPYPAERYSIEGALPLLPVFLCVACRNTFYGVLKTRPLALLGTASFSIYMIHMAIVYLIVRAFNQFVIQINSVGDTGIWALALACALVAVFCSLLTYRYISPTRRPAASSACRHARRVPRHDTLLFDGSNVGARSCRRYDAVRVRRDGPLSRGSSRSPICRCRCVPLPRIFVAISRGCDERHGALTQGTCHAAQTGAGQASRPNVRGYVRGNRRKCFRRASVFGRSSRCGQARTSRDARCNGCRASMSNSSTGWNRQGGNACDTARIAKNVSSARPCVSCARSGCAVNNRDLAATYQQAKDAVIDKAAFADRTRKQWNFREKNCRDKACLTSWYAYQKRVLTKIAQTGDVGAQDN